MRWLMRPAPRAVAGSVASFRETFRHRPRSGSAELLFAEIRNAFDPTSRLIQSWRQLVLLCILYELLMLPYLVIFDPTRLSAPEPMSHVRRLSTDSASAALTPLWKRPEMVGLYLCELLFLLDMYVQLNTGYYEDGDVLRDTRKSRLKYLKSWAFVLDVAALPPLSVIVPTAPHVAWLAAASGQRALLEFHKLLRLWRLPKLISNLDDIYARYFVLLKLTKVLVTTLVVSHMVACGRFLFGYDAHHSDHWLPPAPAPDEPHSTRHQYLMSLFWAFGLLTGLFEGELSHTAPEFIFTITVALCGFSLFTYLCATFFMLSKCEGGDSETAEARVNQFKHLLVFHRVSDKLQKQAVGYLKKYYAQSESNDREASKLLCSSITVDIQIELLQETVASIPVFRGCDDQFIKAVTSLLEMVAYPAHFVLFRSGDHGDAMYVVDSGVLQTLVNGIKVRELRKGSFFGEVAVFANIPRSASVVTTTYSTLYRLSRFHSEKLMLGYPRYAKLITGTIEEMLRSTAPSNASTSNEDGGENDPSDNQRTLSDVPLRKPTRASFMHAITMKRSHTSKAKRGTGVKNPSARITPVGAKDTGSSGGSIPGTGAPPANPHGVGSAQIVPAETIVVSQASTGVNTNPAATPRLNRNRPSLARHLSWRGVSNKVIPGETLLLNGTDNLNRRRSSMAANVQSELSKVATLANRSRSQLELLKNNLLRIGRTSSDSVKSDAMRGFYDQIQRLKDPTVGPRAWWFKLLLSKCIHAESRFRMVWLLLLQIVLCYNWVTVPLLLAFPLFDRPQWYIEVLNAGADSVLWIDLYINLNLSFTVNSETIFDTSRSAIKYLKSGHFFADIMCAFPYAWVVKSVVDTKVSPIVAWSITHGALRLPRLLRVWRIAGHLHEVEEYLVLKSKQRLLFFGIVLIMLYHIVACMHFSITYWEGFSPKEEAWIPSDDIYLHQVNETTYVDIHGMLYDADDDHVTVIQARQYFRSLYYATNVLAALGKTIEPSSDRQYGVALLFMLSGFLITAIVVDNVQKRFTASALEQKEFFATRARIQLFLKRQNAPLSIHQRVNSFLDYWWSTHRGAVIEELLQELPEPIKRDIIRSICKPAIESIGMLFPQIWTEEHGHTELNAIRIQIEELFIDNLRFVLYGQGEVIYREGDYPSGLYFLLEGQVCIETRGEPPRRIQLGGYFGTAALELAQENGLSVKPQAHSEQVTAQSGSIVVYVSREHLTAMQSIFPAFSASLRSMEKRVLVTLRVTRAAEMETGVTKTIRMGPTDRSQPASPSYWRRVQSYVIGSRLWKYAVGEECFDPDATFIVFWELWVFAAMTLQSALVVFHGCLGIESRASITNSNDHSRAALAADVIMLVLEACFLIDLFIRTRLGFYEYGNKVMSLRQIKSHYIGSKYFLIDVVALLPFFLINLGKSRNRYELVNVNKLLRLFKSSNQFRALEAKHVKLTMELRLVRLVYYSFLASHTFGCIWFDFAARSSGIGETSTTNFGVNKWLPYASLEYADRSLQYFASVFWAFGIMTASTTGELPKTVPQCLFTVITMTTGFFLFGYVVGNFLDVIELQDSENRHFIAKLSSLRHLLAHFHLPQGIEEKFKTYFFFKRFHSITQEHVLERVLPPSLLIDIRMFQLQPMIVKVAFLAGMEDSVTRMLVSLFTQQLVVKDMFICKYGEEGKEMFFIFTGVLDIYVPLPPAPANSASTTSMNEKTTNQGRETGAPLVDEMVGFHKVNQITAGSYFGEAALFTRAPRNAHVKARTSCILYRLSRESLELVFERFPDWKLKVLRIVKIQQEQQRLMRLAAEAQEPEGSGSVQGTKRRSLKQTMSRLDLINSRAQDMEELVLANTRGGRGTRFSPAEWILKHPKSVQFVQRYIKPVIVKTHRCIVFLTRGAEVQSPFYIFWLRLVTLCTVYVALITPYRCAFDSLDRWTAFPTIFRVLEGLTDIVFWWDIWLHFRVRESLAAMELYEQDHLQAYKRERLVWDVLAAFPLDHFLEDQFFGSARSTVQKWCRLNRCLKVANLAYYRLEVNRRSVTYELNRFVTIWMVYLLVIYWTSCAYFAVAMHDGFGDAWQAWLPSKKLYDTDDSEVLLLRVFRGLAFAVTAFVKKGRTFTPTRTLDYVFSIVISFVGQLSMALMIGEIASIFILYIDNEVEFRKNHIALELFLSRKSLSQHLKLRCASFLTSWWSSHAGVNYQVIFDDLPPTVRTEGVMHITEKPLVRFMDRVFRPLTRGYGFQLEDDEEAADLAAHGEAAVENLMYAIAQHLHFEGYPRGEDVIVEGTVCRAVFFVVKGYLYSKSVSNPSLYHAGRFRMGDYFGEKGLLGHSVSLFTVTTVRACDLFVLRSERLIDVIKSHPYFSVLLRMAQDIVRQNATPDEYFADAINQERRDFLPRRLSASTSTNNLQRSRTMHGRSLRRSMQSGKEAPIIQRVLLQSSQVEWDDAFRLFMEMIVPRGTLNVSVDDDSDKNRDNDEDEQAGALTTEPHTRTKRSKSRLIGLTPRSSGLSGSSDMSGFSGSSAFSGMSVQSSRDVSRMSPKFDAVKKRQTTNPAGTDIDITRILSATSRFNATTPEPETTIATGPSVGDASPLPQQSVASPTVELILEAQEPSNP